MYTSSLVIAVFVCLCFHVIVHLFVNYLYIRYITKNNFCISPTPIVIEWGEFRHTSPLNKNILEGDIYVPPAPGSTPVRLVLSDWQNGIFFAQFAPIYCRSEFKV